MNIIKYIVFCCILIPSICFGATEITAPGANCTTDGETYYLTQDLTTSSTVDYAIEITGDNITIDGMGHTITVNSGQATYGVYVSTAASNITIKGLNIITTGVTSYYLNGSVSPSVLSMINCTATKTGAGNVVALRCPATFVNCRFVSNTDGVSAISATVACTYGVITNCTIKAQGSSGYGITTSQTDAAGCTLTLKNNIIATTGALCFNCATSFTGLTHSNNRYYRTSGDATQHVTYNGSTYTGSQITNFEATGTTGSPSFVTEWTDLTLQSSSNVIGIGDNSATSITYDLLGNNRVSSTTIDLGAYEYTATNNKSGSCCLTDQVCEIMTELICETLYSGTYRGDDTDCETECSAITGPCCLLDGSCYAVEQDSCTTIAGSYGGDNNACDPNPCSVTITTSSTHPRLILLADSLSTYRSRFYNGGGDFNIVGTEVRDWCDANLTADYSTHTPYYVEGYALGYVLTQNAEYADTAIAIAKRAAVAKTNTYNEGGGTAIIGAVAIVYDWCYDRISESDRAALRDSVYWHHKTTGRSGGEYNGIESYSWQPRDVQWGYMVAMAKDYTDPVKKQWMLDKLKDSMDAIDDFYIPCVDEARPNGAIDGYSMPRTWTVFVELETLKKSTNYLTYGGGALTSQYFNNTPYFWLYRHLDKDYCYRTPGKYNPQFDEAKHWSLFSSDYNCYECQYLATSAIDDLIDTDYLDSDSAILDDYNTGIVAWYKPYLQSRNPNTLALDYYDSGSRMSLARSGWDMATTNNDIHTFFFNGPDLEWHQTEAQGHFTIDRGEDNLLIDSGRYGRDSDIGFQAYYMRGIAHNIMRVYDSAEVFEIDGENYIDDSATSLQVNIPNDGGQAVWDVTCGDTNLYPDCEISSEPGVDKVACRGSNTAYSYNNDYTFVDANTTLSYNTGKVTSANRRWLYVKPNFWFIFDKIRLAKTGPLVINTFHTVNKPTISGSATTKYGHASYGGVFWSTNSSNVVIDRNDSRAKVFFLQDSGSTADSVYVIGGPSTSNASWKQCFDSNDTQSYVADCANQSYEFYIDGLNYPPYQVGYTTLINYRYDYPNEAGDWRFEHTLGGGTAAADVTDAIVIWAGDEADETGVSATAQTFGSHVIALVTYGTNNIVIGSSPSGATNADTLAYNAEVTTTKHVLAGMLPSTRFRITEETGSGTNLFYAVSDNAGVIQFSTGTEDGGIYTLGDVPFPNMSSKKNPIISKIKTVSRLFR